LQNILEIENLSIVVGGKKNYYEIVSDISLSVPKGEIIGLVGESGCGKTVTALSIMKLLAEPPLRISGGKIIFNNKNLLDLSSEELRKIRGNDISMIFQEPVSSLNPVFTIGDQIGESLRTHKNLSKIEEKTIVIEMLNRVGIPDAESRYNNYPHEMSGGMCQRVMIAMALSCNPQLLIADEPTTALDVTVQAGILELIQKLRSDTGMSVILITHDLGIISEIADKVYVMYAGKIVEYASKIDLFRHPRHPYTKGLLASIPDINLDEQHLNTIKGNIPSPENYPSGCRFNDRCEYVIDKCRNNIPPLEDLSDSHKTACFRSKELNL
jgi:oligopeptide/dipeptide ABC transporter ATP-binding protein